MLIRRLASAFDLSPVRARAVMRAGLFFFAFVGGVTALKSATNALFLVRCDPRDLPYLYLATALAVTLVTVHLGKSLTSFGAKPILRSSLVVAAIFLLCLAVLASLDFRPALGVLYVAGEVYATAISVLFWARLGEVFDVRTAKRVFGTIAAAGMGGAVVGGLLVRSLAHALPREVWCFVAVATIAGMYPLLGKDRARSAIQQRTISFREGLLYAIVERFPRGVAFLVLLLSVQTAAVDYVFRTGAVLFEGGDEAALAGMFGVLNAIVGVAALAVQVFLTGPLLRHLGVFAFLAIIPGLSVIAASWAALFPAMFVPLFLLKTFEMMGSLSLNQPGLQLLYNPMPAAVRDSVRALIDGAVKKLGGAAGGVLLIFFGSLLEQRQLLGLVIALAFLLIIWIGALKKGYLVALEAKLGARGGSPIPPIDPADRATREQLVRALSNDDPGKVLAAISVLAQDKRLDLKNHIEVLIAHADEGVRVKAIELIASAPDPAYAPFLVSIIQNDARRPKAQAARALELVDPATARRVLEPILEAPTGLHDLGLVCAAIAALQPGGRSVDAGARDDRSKPRGSEIAKRALERLLARGRSGSAAERREIARLLGLLGPGPYAPQLAVYLDDPEASVRVLAVRSAGLARDALLPPKLVPRLNDRSSQRAVRDALSAYGDEVVPLLAETLDDRRLPLHLRVQVPRILRQIGSERAAEAMLFSNVQDDAFLRYVIIEELSRMRRTQPSLRFDRQRTEEAALRRIRAFTHYRPIARDFADAPPTFGLLRRAVEDRVRQNLEAALRLLGMLYDMTAMENAFRGLLQEDPTTRADALELIDVALQRSDIKGEVLRNLEVIQEVAVSREVSSKLPAGSSRAIERAHALVESRDMQLSMIAWETLKRIGEDPQEVREPSVGEPLMPKSIVDRVFLLEGVQLFHGLSVDDLAAVAALATQGHAQPGEVIYLEGDPGDSMYVIISGEVRLLRGQKTLMDLTQGDSFGQVSILDRGPRPVTARAGDEGVDYLMLERGPFMDLLSDRPQVMNGLFIVLARRLRELVELTGHPPGRPEPRPGSQIAGSRAQESA